MNLFFNSVDNTLHIYNQVANAGVQCLAAYRICFSQHFLADEIQPSANIFVAFAGFFKLLEVGIETGNLFGDIASFRDGSDFQAS